MITGIQLKHGIHSHGPVETADILRVLLNAPQNRIAGLALLIPQRKIYAVRWSLWLMSKDVLLQPWKP